MENVISSSNGASMVEYEAGKFRIDKDATFLFADRMTAQTADYMR